MTEISGQFQISGQFDDNFAIWEISGISGLLGPCNGHVNVHVNFWSRQRRWSEECVGLWDCCQVDENVVYVCHWPRADITEHKSTARAVRPCPWAQGHFFRRGLESYNVSNNKFGAVALYLIFFCQHLPMRFSPENNKSFYNSLHDQKWTLLTGISVILALNLSFGPAVRIIRPQPWSCTPWSWQHHRQPLLLETSSISPVKQSCGVFSAVKYQYQVVPLPGIRRCYHDELVARRRMAKSSSAEASSMAVSSSSSSSSRDEARDSIKTRQKTICERPRPAALWCAHDNSDSDWHRPRSPTF